MSSSETINLISSTIAALDAVIPYNFWANDDSAPPEYTTVRRRLPIARDVLESIKGKVEHTGGDGLATHINSTLRACEKKAEKLESIFREVHRTLTQSESHLFAISHWYSAEVASLGRGIMADVGSLIETQSEADNRLLRYLRDSASDMAGGGPNSVP